MKSNLDEMQEQKLLHTEKLGLGFAFWGLLVAIVVQFFIGADYKQLAGEAIVLMGIGIITAFGCFKNGIWDRRLKPNLKTNMLLSIVTSLGVGLIIGISNYLHSKEQIVFSALFTAFTAFILFLIIFQISALICRKRVRKIEAKIID